METVYVEFDEPVLVKNGETLLITWTYEEGKGVTVEEIRIVKDEHSLDSFIDMVYNTST